MVVLQKEDAEGVWGWGGGGGLHVLQPRALEEKEEEDGGEVGTT